MKRKLKKVDLDFKIDLKPLEGVSSAHKKDCKECFLERVAIVSMIKTPVLSHKKVIEKYGEDTLFYMIVNEIGRTDITLEETIKLFIKKKILKKSDLK